MRPGFKGVFFSHFQLPENSSKKLNPLETGCQLNVDTKFDLHPVSKKEWKFNSENLKTAKLSQKWVFSDLQLVNLKKKLGNFFLIGIHSMQGWKATTRHELQEKEPQKD